MRLLLVVAFAALVAVPAYAGRPLTIDDAEPVAPGAYELELGLLFSKAPGERHVDLPVALQYGLTPTLEVSAVWGAHARDRLADFNNGGTVSGPADLALGFKWMPIRTEAGLMFALSGTAKLSTGNEQKGLGTGDEDYDLTLIVTKQWANYAVDANLGRTWVGDRFDATLTDIVHYGAAVHYSPSETLTLVGEVFADDPRGAKAQWQANVGVQYALRKNFVLDAAFGRKLNAPGPDWVTKIVFTATF